MSYFASKPTDELLPELKNRVENFHKYKEKTGEAKKWRKSYDLYFGKHIKGGDNSEISHVGEDDELTAYGVNHYRNLIKHVLALSCSQKPSYDYRAKNSDLKSLNQAKLANNIIDGYLVEKRMARHMKQAAERSLSLKLGYVYTTWDTSLGRPLMVEPVIDENGLPKLDEDGTPLQKVRYEGDVEMCSKSPWDVIHDVHLKDWSKCKWVIVKEYENKYDLSARYPKFKEEIEKLSASYDFEEFNISKQYMDYIETDSLTEIIPTYSFYHLPTAALPSGRYVKFLTAKIPLYDGPYQYASKSGNHKLPVHRITPGEKFDTVDGYSEFYDIMVLQQVLNLSYSTILTNQSPFGTQAIWLPDGCDLSVEQISGMAVLKGGPPGSEPKAIQLTATPQEIFKNAEMVERAMEKLSGINSVVRGDPEQGIKSGVALGRLQQMAIQFSSNFQQGWAELQEDVGTFMIHLLQNFADTERMTATAGKRNKGAMKSWKGSDIDMIERLICDLGNPAFRTSFGRQDLAEKLLDKGLIKDPTQFFQVIETGTIEPMFEAPTSKLELIRRENELLMEGKAVKALVGDSHVQHAQEHRVILDDPEIRTAAENGDELAMLIVENTLAHILNHKDLETTQDPFWFAVSGEQPPLPPPGPPPSDSGGGQQPPDQPTNIDGPGIPQAPPIPDLPPEVA